MRVDKCTQNVTERSEWNGPLGKPSYREENSKRILTDTEWEGVEWITVTQKSPMMGFCEHDNNISGLIKSREYFDQLRDSQLFKDSNS
jgi:hypothetical protein